MRNVMTRAWEIAKEGQNKFGGKVSEYLSEALKMAWAETKTVEFTTTSGSKKHKSWIAEITGTHPQYKLNREFINPVEENDYAGKTFELENGKVYEVCNAGDRDFVEVVDGDVYYIEFTDVMGAVA